MTDIKDLARFVEEHPDDHESRWRLAKKLYMASDYVHVLEHLQILQARWIPRVNVRRYLGATYYRLKRYDEAIEELREAVDEWPDEIPLREQLARVLDVAGRPAEADHIWQEILRRDPTRMALRMDDTPEPGPVVPEESEPVKKRSGNQRVAQPNEGSRGYSGLSGAALSIGRVCPSCGAQNTDEFDRCWKCHTEFASVLNVPAMPFSPLVPTPSPDTTPRIRLKQIPSVNEVWHIPVATLAGLFLIAGIYITSSHLSGLRSGESAAFVYTTVRELFARQLAASHLVVGLVVLFAWPGSLWLAATLIPRSEVSGRTVIILGSLLATFGYLLSWAPPQWLGYMLPVLLVLSAGAVLMTFRMELRRALMAWAIHAVLLLSVLTVIIVALEGFAGIIQYPAVARFASANDTAANKDVEPGRSTVPEIHLPKQYTITFRSTGSSWLDTKVTATSFEITGARPEDNLAVELKDENRTRYYGHADTDPFLFTCEIVPERPYQITLDGKSEGRVTLTIRGLLRAEFKE